MAHNPEHSAEAQLALVVAVKLLLTTLRANPLASAAMADEMERMRANLLATNSTDQKLHAFDETAGALLNALKSS